MSIAIMTSIFGNRRKGIPGSRFKDTKRFVLLAIADNANADGYCWPSIEEIAFKVGIEKRSVKRIINEDLVPSGELYLSPRTGYSNQYLVTLDLTEHEIAHALTTYFDMDKVAAAELSYRIIEIRESKIEQPVLLGDDPRSPGGDPRSPKPSSNPQPEPTKGGDLKSPLTKVLPPTAEEIHFVDIDESGEEIPWEWDKDSPFFKRIASQILGTPKNLKLKERKQWMELQRLASRDYLFLHWTYWLAGDLNKPTFAQYMSQVMDANSFEDWQTGVKIKSDNLVLDIPGVSRSLRAIAPEKDISPGPEPGTTGITVPNPLLGE